MQYDYICHHGTQGMKWGRRLYQNADGSLTPLGRMRYGSGKGKGTIKTKDGRTVPTTKLETETLIKKPTTSTTETAEAKPNYSAKARAKNIDEMTDNELNSYLNRITLEQRYAQLTKEPEQKKKVSAGRRFVNYTASQILLPTVTTIAKGSAEYYGKKFVNKLAGENVFGGNDQKKK